MDLAGSLLFLVVLSVALGLAWLGGYRSRFRKVPGLKRSPDQDYFVGLNYLLNDEPDDAIDVFIAALEPNSNTLETHLALCTLLRRRGKVDRAIAHAQFLLTDKSFTPKQVAEIKINLVRSHIAAGLLDRAERLLEELQRDSPSNGEMALGLAMSVYQMEKDWAKALRCALELLKICPAAKRAELQMQASHFHCELAEAALAQQDVNTAQSELASAAGVFRNNVRIYLLQAQIDADEGRYAEAVSTLCKVLQHDRTYSGEALTAMLACYRADPDKEALVPVLEEVLAGESGNRPALARAALIAERQGRAAALQALQQGLQSRHSLGLMARVLDFAAQEEQGAHKVVLRTGAAVLEQFLNACPQYRCENCGFDLKHLHWLCPGCSKWNTVKPLEDNISRV
jgi:lipopolysaccharide assembly protein B